MEAESFTPLFTVDQDIATFLVSCGILSEAWEVSRLANNSDSFSLNEYEGVVYVAFPSFHKIEGFNVKDSGYGEVNIFSGLKGNDDQPALVHPGALKLFLDIMQNTDFQEKLQIYTDWRQRKLKPIIFVGHSLGGAVATLATLWVLGKRLRQSSPFCLTFGCPLVGDERLVEAIGRENWGGNFCHVVSNHDIVPRMLLAPFESIEEPLIAILPYWKGEVPDSSIQDACMTLYDNVLQYTDHMGSDAIIKRSPYKPFGTYMFCTSHGAACIANSETVLKMLHLTMVSPERLSVNNVQDCLSEHIGYGKVLKDAIKSSISRRRFANPDSKSSYEMGISLQLEAIGVGAQNDCAQLALRSAGETENKYNTNVDELAFELSQNQINIAELEWYKVNCENGGGSGYYDSFKNQMDKKDISADFRREGLAKFWDKVIKMWECDELPSDFSSQNKWIIAGNTYRLFVEPLDIAYYYRTNGNGNYLSDGRPNRHKVLHNWMEAKEKTRSSRVKKPRTKPATLTQDSCFWAYVEEAQKDLENLKQGQHQRLQNLEEFEKYVTEMESSLSISSYVFLEGSSFMMWWEEWKEYKTSQTPDWSSRLCQKMEHLKIEWIGSYTAGQENNSFTGENDIAQRKAKVKAKEKEIELAVQQSNMFQLEWYKMDCHEKGDMRGYYDSFKNQNYKKDRDADECRSILALFWDGIIKTWSNRELPSDFQSQNKWINAGAAYRKLVEPLDIADYYRTSKGNGNYLLNGRPIRHKVLQNWLEDRKKNRNAITHNVRTKLPSLTRDSCFWAHVEEALKDLKQGLPQEVFEKYVTERINERNISSDVFLKGSSFMTWWQEYEQLQSPEWKENSSLYDIITRESWKL